MATPIPPNDAPFTLAELLGATGGRLHGAVDDDATRAVGVGTDTRTLRPGQVFVALTGERFDGHTHLSTAAAAGAHIALVERSLPPVEGLTQLVVPSTLGALGALGRLHVRRWRRGAGGVVIALTGSAGKTTTKNAVAALLEEQVGADAVLATEGNLNNRIGVPMTALGLGAGHRFAVLELGMNTPGEIAALRDICEPDVAVITLIAAAHTEGVGSIEAVAREKTALWSRLGPSAVAVGNVDDVRVAAALAACPATHRIGYGVGEAAAYRVLRRAWVSPTVSALTLAAPDGSTRVIRTSLLGRAGALASAAALAVVEHVLGAVVPAEAASRALSRSSLAPGRLAPRALAGDRLLLDDSYNANPASCRASIEAAAELAAWRGGELVLVLGAMRELGALGPAAHEEVGTFAASVAPRRIVAVGRGAEPIDAAARRAGVDASFSPSADEAAAQVRQLVRPGDVVLVKGSRGVHTERVVEALLDAYPEPGRGGGTPLRHPSAELGAGGAAS